MKATSSLDTHTSPVVPPAAEPGGVGDDESLPLGERGEAGVTRHLPRTSAGPVEHQHERHRVSRLIRGGRDEEITPLDACHPEGARLLDRHGLRGRMAGDETGQQEAEQSRNGTKSSHRDALKPGARPLHNGRDALPLPF